MSGTVQAPARGLFIAGTDTGVGKTRLVAGLLRALRNAGWQAAGMKPVATGAARTAMGFISEDATIIGAESTLIATKSDLRADINPYCFEPPVSPHIAAQKAGISIETERICASFARLAGRCDVVIVEGTGGWLAPTGPRTTMADIGLALGLPVILVVGVRLGCLNHALLSVESIVRAGARLYGWVGNLIDPGMAALTDNVATLGERIPAPRLGLLANAPDVTGDALELAALARKLMSELGPAP
jgi:dethiobiotin synthetase